MSYRNGIGAINRRIAPRLPLAPSSRVTNAAPTTLLARAGFTPRESARVYGVFPVETVEGFEPDGAYDVRPIDGLGREPSGLGQTDEQVIAARDQLLGMITRTLPRLEPYLGSSAGKSLRGQIANAEQRFQEGISLFYGGNNAAALSRFVAGITIMHQVSPAIDRLRPEDRRAAQAQSQTQAGALVTNQISRTLDDMGTAVSEPVAAALDTISPAAAEAVRSAGWILPVGAGLALFLLLRR